MLNIKVIPPEESHNGKYRVTIGFAGDSFNSQADAMAAEILIERAYLAGRNDKIREIQKCLEFDEV